MTTLFPATESLSPRARWLRDNDLRVIEYQHVHSLNRDGMRFVCCNRSQTRYASGATEDEAELAFAARYDLPWWKLAEWNGAMDCSSGKDKTIAVTFCGDTMVAMEEW